MVKAENKDLKVQILELQRELATYTGAPRPATPPHSQPVLSSNAVAAVTPGLAPREISLVSTPVDSPAKKRVTKEEEMAQIMIPAKKRVTKEEEMAQIMIPLSPNSSLDPTKMVTPHRPLMSSTIKHQ